MTEYQRLEEAMKKRQPCLYRGVTVTPLIGGYQVFSNKVLTLPKVDEAIDFAEKSIENSIVPECRSIGRLKIAAYEQK